MAPAAGSYDGGAGGVFRKRSSRNRSTPYDRPPTGRHALRNPVQPAYTTSGATGWFSKLKDPLSRIVQSSYTRFFSLGSRKRLGPPATNSEPLLESRDESPNEVSNKPFSVVQEHIGSEGGGPSNSSESIGLAELEQLLRQKTFTRVEIDHLTELLRSRTVDSSKDDDNKFFAPDTLEPAATSNIPHEENRASVRINGDSTSTPAACSSVPVHGEVTSAAEFAKAYMGTMSSRLSPSTLGLRGQTFREDVPFQNNVPYAPKSPSSSFAPRSGIRFSSVPRFAEEAHLTPRSQGGTSVLHNMARSPYSRPAQSIAYPKGSGDGYAGPSTSSQLLQAKGVLSGGRQALKRQSSFLDDDFGSIGPIRRIRQRPNMMTRQSFIISPISSDVGPSSSSSSQQLLQLDGPKDITSNIKSAENGDHRIARASLASVPSESTETARKILEQLDKMVPSPKEKSTISKLAHAMEKSPAKLTLNMLHGPARRSMDDIESPNFPDVQRRLLDDHNGSTSLSPESSIAREKDKVGENGVLEPTDGGKMASKADGRGNAIIHTTNIFTSTKAVDSVSLGFAANPPQNKQPFQMSAPEDFLEDDDSYSGKKNSTAQNDKQEPPQSENKAVAPEAEVQKPGVNFTELNPAAHSTLRTELVKRASVGSIVTGKSSSGFTFPVTPATEVLSDPPTPTPMLSTVFAIPVQSKEQTSSPFFSFASSSIGKTSGVPASSTTFSTIETSSFKFGAVSDSKAETKDSDSTAFVKVPLIPPETPLVTQLASPSTLPAPPPVSSPATAVATSLANTDSHKTDKICKNGDLLQSSQNGSSSTSASPSIFSGFSSSTTSTLVNGLMPSTLSTVAVSTAPAAPVSGSSTNPFSSNSSPSISVAATVPATPVFQFGSASAVPALANSVSPPSTISAHETSDLAPKDKPDNPSPFGRINSSFPAISSGQYTSTGSSIFGLSTPTISSTPITTNTSNNQSQSSASPFGAIAGSLFGSQTSTAGTTVSSFAQSTPNQFGSSSSSPSFGLSGSSIFGSSNSQTSTAGTTVSSFTQSAPNQFGSSSSSPSFGLSGSSIFGSSSSPFGSSIFGSKPFSLSSGFGSTSSVPSTIGSGTSPFGTSSSPFSSNSQSSAPSFFASGFGSTSSPATGFSFGGSSTAGSVSFGGSSTAGNISFGGSTAAGFSFGSSLSASSGPLFSFTSTASAATPGSLAPLANFGSASLGNDQMNIEDSMAEDTVQAPTPGVPSFGTGTSSPSPSNFVFGSPSIPSAGPSTFQFGAQNPGAPQTPSPFVGAGDLEFSGGSFSLGGGAGDKSNRRIIKVKRDKGRRK